MPTYLRHRGEWTVRATVAELEAAIEAARGAGTDEIYMTVTLKSGRTKRQRITGRGWQIASSRDRTACVYALRLPEDERQGSSTRGGECAECGRRSRALDEAPDSSGIVLPVCPRCYRLPDYLRSYA